MRPEFFSMPELRQGFEDELTQLLRKKLRDLRAVYINPRNEQMYHHGSTWKAPEESGAEDTTIVTHQHIVELPFSKVIEHDLSVVPRYIENIVSGMFGQFQAHLFKTVEEVTTRSGNVVDAAGSRRGCSRSTVR